MPQEFNPFSELRKESLDIYNRLHSIQEDVSFVNTIHEAYPNLPLIPNLRCGAWYTDPAIATNVPAYFKSTDGHNNNWGFNLRRSNLHLLSVVLEYSGIVLVDSTRSGKRLPDALSKTIPIWCSVINRALLIRFPELENNRDWDTSLYTPPTTVSSQEHDQIALRLDGWADALAKSSFDLPKLPHPLRPFWITPATTNFPHFSSDIAFLPIICVSASKQVHDGTERRTSGFSYIQGSGDDHELWGMGLDPQIFWNHRDELISTSRAELPTLVASLVSGPRAPSTSCPEHSALNPPEEIVKVANRIALTTLANAQIYLPPNLPSRTSLILIDELTSPAPQQEQPAPTATPPVAESTEETPSSDPVLRFAIPTGKKSQTSFLHDVLPTALPYINSKLSAGSTIIIACPSGKDLSVGLALAAIATYFDDTGTYIGKSNSQLTKQTIRTRLEWIIASCPRANPSRTTLKRVNEFLLTAEHLRR